MVSKMIKRNIAISLDQENPEFKMYTGIGSRNITDPTIKDIMIKIGYYLALDGWVLRSGGSKMSDEYFEMGADLACLKTGLRNKIIYLPWGNFNNNPSKWNHVNPEALNHARKYLPFYDNLRDSVKRIMGRNTYQVLGYLLNIPSKFLICWTPDGCKTMLERSKETGGTGQAIAIASDNKIPVFNLQVKEDLNKVLIKLQKYEENFGKIPDYNILYNEDLEYSYKDLIVKKTYKSGSSTSITLGK